MDPNESKLQRNGNPSFASDTEKALLLEYTETARKNGLVPLFDLVLNHVAKDSPLVSNQSPHFQQLQIDTSKWFKNDTAQHWDDIVPFNYEDSRTRQEIIEHFWLPILTKYVNDFGFMGVRVDFATGLSPELQRELFPILEGLVRDKFMTSPIIFAECLPPKGLDRIAQDYRELYTHVTNNINWTMASSGHDIGTKQQLTH
jgi:alpha-amylase